MLLAPETSLPAEEESDPADQAAPQSKRRMLIVVNPYATTVSDRLKNLVVYALQGRYEVDAVLTEAQNHATDISREAVDGGYDVVCAFGGDGTLNEVANGLVGTGIPVTMLPGGSTNVVCRTLGIPNDVVDATEHLLRLADDFRPRTIDLGVVNDRHFLFSCGIGLDATVVKRVDSKPRLKARAGEWYFTWAAISGFYRHYLRGATRFRLQTDQGELEGITAIIQNSDPFTYFATRPIHICEEVGFASGTLSAAVLRRAVQRDMPSVAARVLHSGLRATAHRQIDGIQRFTEGAVLPVGGEETGEQVRLPVQVDGDYIGELAELRLGISPAALTVVA